jgi:dihydroorotate dehydrogenase
MLFYKFFIKQILFLFKPETAHKITFFLLKLPLVNFFLILFFKRKYQKAIFIKSNLKFPNRIGLAAGLDKEGEITTQLSNIGFGFIEIGTVTPKAQAGNEKPRLFRLKSDKALINRMGFNNLGAEEMKKKLEKLKNRNSLIGINLGKNKTTELENAHLDYLESFKILHNYGDYFVVNVSSPNTPNLRVLQEKNYLEKIFDTLYIYNNSQKIQKPILLKIAPDLTYSQIDQIIEIVKAKKIFGLVATNTTISREELITSTSKIEKIGNGGLSGLPLKNKSTEIIKYLRKNLGNEILIIGVGGIFNYKGVEEKIDAGADVVQIYTSFIYEGPTIVNKILKKMSKNNK